jgi:hypothetical protein
MASPKFDELQEALFRRVEIAKHRADSQGTNWVDECDMNVLCALYLAEVIFRNMEP